jgi:hypothetical protein
MNSEMATPAIASSNPVEQCALSVLQAWIRGDAARLREEREMSAVRASGLNGFGGSDERMELLAAITERLMPETCREMPSETDPQVRLCLGLLAHLARPQGCLD